MAELQDIDKLKAAIKFGIDLGQQIKEANKDGWQWTDSLGFIDDAAKVPGVIKSGPEMLLELKDLSDVEREELKVYVQTEFDIPNDDLEFVIEDALNISFSIVSLITRIPKRK